MTISTYDPQFVTNKLARHSVEWEHVCTSRNIVQNHFLCSCSGLAMVFSTFVLIQDYLRDQMTITEVTMARLYNWDVKRRKEKKGETGAAIETKA